MPIRNFTTSDRILITASVRNTSSQSINCTSVIEVIDKDGFIEYINWTAASIPPTDFSAVGGAIWTPKESGNHTVYLFLISDIYNDPTALAEKRTSTIMID